MLVLVIDSARFCGPPKSVQMFNCAHTSRFGFAMKSDVGAQTPVFDFRDEGNRVLSYGAPPIADDAELRE